ncbi:uncharacterized protein LOC122643523 [Telopea speciosissima]|uniref:uncharacterized protein LOC122643523 n=1 Tax=Telopea speciosissima TaxID=54955 RepID=UPI001CC45974|nr:uncharacterized protein LOC122643523 [Telopea speciosissima]
MVECTLDTQVRPFLVDRRHGPAYEESVNALTTDGTSWSALIIDFIRERKYLTNSTASEQKRLQKHATQFVLQGGLLYKGPTMLHLLNAPWPFSTWGIDIIGKVTPKASNGHEFIFMTIDYFTKWVEAQSYAVLIATKVAKFIKENIICRYGVPHALISDQGAHFWGKADKFCANFGIQRHQSTTYKPQTNGAVEAANKNVKVIAKNG